MTIFFDKGAAEALVAMREAHRQHGGDKPPFIISPQPHPESEYAGLIVYFVEEDQ